MTELLVRAWDGAVVAGPVEPVAALTREGLAASGEVPPVTLSVGGGLLLWPWSRDDDDRLDPDATLGRPPLAILDDAEEAQDWLWALYGRGAAAAVKESGRGSQSRVPWAPGQQWLPGVAARFAFGAWLGAWWPASTMDGIRALSPEALRNELEPLAARLDVLLGGAEPPLPEAAPMPDVARDRYALAAGAPGDDSSTPLGAGVATGVCGTDWSDWPAGWVDASDLAVSWRLLQDLGHWTLRVRVVAGPQAPADGARLVAVAPGCRVALRPGRDALGPCWLGEATGSQPGHLPEHLRVYLPGFAPVRPTAARAAGPRAPAPLEAERAGSRALIRDLARGRLSAAAGARPGEAASVAAPWLAEIVVATDDDE